MIYGHCAIGGGGASPAGEMHETENDGGYLQKHIINKMQKFRHLADTRVTHPYPCAKFGCGVNVTFCKGVGQLGDSVATPPVGPYVKQLSRMRSKE